MHTKFSLKLGGAHLGRKDGSVNLHSVLHKKGIINWVTVVSEFIFYTSQLHIYIYIYLYISGTQWRSWLRHCATSQKVAGLIPDGVIGFFH